MIQDVCDVKLSYEKCQRIVPQELNMQLIAVKSVPTLLRDDQKAVCFELKEQTKNDPNFTSTIIIGAETWIYVYDPETAEITIVKTPNSPRPKKA
jgi:hypothetical protein